MSITAAERNRKKRERKKADKQRQQDLLRAAKGLDDKNLPDPSSIGKNTGDIKDIEIEYVSEPFAEITGFFVDNKPYHEDDEGGVTSQQSTEKDVTADTTPPTQDENDILAVLRRFAIRSSVSVVSEDDQKTNTKDGSDEEEDDSKSKERELLCAVSRRKIRELVRPTVAELKQKVSRPDLVEAHDVTAADPEFLLFLKSVPNTVPVPRHWGRKRKYLQGKRGIEKAPWPLPHFLRQTGIAELRNTQAAEEAKLSLKQKQRQRVQVRGGVDVDYKTLHDAFFKYQTKPPLSGWGDLYYEGKEFELRGGAGKFVPGVLSDRLRGALGMTSEKSPPPWLMNMQRYGPPPTYPSLTIPGLNAPLPEGCSYGFHVNGWGKPPVDAFGRGLYGDVFGPPSDGLGAAEDGWKTTGPDEISSDGKRLSRSFWGALPSAKPEEEEESEEEEMEDSSSDEEEGEEERVLTKEGAAALLGSGMDLMEPSDGLDSVAPSSAVDLRKAAGDETPKPKQLYTVLETKEAARQSGAIFHSETAYVLPSDKTDTTFDASGAESVLSKAPRDESNKRKRGNKGDDDEDDDLSKKFKF